MRDNFHMVHNFKLFLREMTELNSMYGASKLRIIITVDGTTLIYSNSLVYASTGLVGTAPVMKHCCAFSNIKRLQYLVHC